MAKKYLDYNGLSYLWGKIKAYGNSHWGGGGSILDFYPVGSYYHTSDTSFNPNTAWGGTWVQDSKGKVLVAQDSTQTEFQTVGQEGGEKTHTLVTSEIPAHTHGSKTLTGSLTWDRRFTGTTTATGIVSKTNTSVASYFQSTSGTAASNMTKMTVTATHEHDSVGDGDAHNNLQPYTVVVRWHRIA